MLKYRVIKGYVRTDNTLVKGDLESVEYSLTHAPFESMKDARIYLKYIAFKEGMTVYNEGHDAEKEIETVNEETGITIYEKEWLRIEFVA